MDDRLLSQPRFRGAVQVGAKHFGRNFHTIPDTRLVNWRLITVPDAPCGQVKRCLLDCSLDNCSSSKSASDGSGKGIASGVLLRLLERVQPGHSEIRLTYEQFGAFCDMPATTLFRAHIPTARLQQAEKVLARLGMKPGERSISSSPRSNSETISVNITTKPERLLSTAEQGKVCGGLSR